jgi:hypothetical protein
VDVEFEAAAMVEFEAVAFPPLAFPFFPVALVLAARAVAVSLADKGKQKIVSDSMCNLPAALFFSGERAKTSETILRQRCFRIAARCSPTARGSRASRPSSDKGRARPETRDAEMARSVRMDPKFFMMMD